MKICDFTMPEIRNLLAECNFTEDEEILFLFRIKDVPLEKCAEKMNLSVATVCRINQKIRDKVQRIEMYQSKSTMGNDTSKN